MTEPTKREKGLMDQKTAISIGVGLIEEQWPKVELDDPMVRKGRKAVVRLRQYDKNRLGDLAQIIDGILLNADGFAVMFELAAKKPAEFQALAVWAKIELDRKPEAVAA